MGASYANAPDGAATGASSFYTLVLTLYLAAIARFSSRASPKAQKRGARVALAVSCAGSFVAFKRVHPAAVAWADASSVFDPYDILQIPSRPTPQSEWKSSWAPHAISLSADGTSGQGLDGVEAHEPAQMFGFRNDPERARAHRRATPRCGAGTTRRGFGHPDGPGRPSRASRCRTASRRRPLVCTC